MRLTPDESPGGSLSDQRLLANSLRHLRRALIEPDDSVRVAALNVAFVRWQVENICCSVIEERCGRDEGAWNIASIRIIAAFRLVDRALQRDAWRQRSGSASFTRTSVISAGCEIRYRSSAPPTSIDRCHGPWLELRVRHEADSTNASHAT
jgi:hypothetical protein